MAGSASLTPYQNLLGTAGVAAAQRLTGDSGNDVAPTSDILVSADKFGGHPEMVSQVYVEQASVNGGPIKTHYHPAKNQSNLPYGTVQTPTNGATGTNVLGSGNSVIFNVQTTGMQSLIKSIYFEMTIRNNNVAALTLCPSHLLLATSTSGKAGVQFYFNNNSSNALNYYGDLLYWNYVQRSTWEQRKILAKDLHVDADTFSPTGITIAAGATVRIRMELPSPVTHGGVLLPTSIFNSLNYTINWGTADPVVAGGGSKADLDVQNLTLVLEPIIVSQSRLNSIVSTYKNGNISLKVFDQQYESQALVTPAPGSTLQYQLKNIRGIVSELSMLMYISTGAVSDYYTSLIGQLATGTGGDGTFQLTTQSGQNLISNNQTQMGYLFRYQYWMNGYTSFHNTVSGKELFTFFFAPGGQKVVGNTGRFPGYQYLWQNNLQFGIPVGGLAAGTYQTTFFAPRLMYLTFFPDGPRFEVAP
jgi:hypothetical protein